MGKNNTIKNVIVAQHYIVVTPAPHLTIGPVPMSGIVGVLMWEFQLH